MTTTAVDAPAAIQLRYHLVSISCSNLWRNKARRAAESGALALAYATNEPRGTRDIDVNVFVGVNDAPAVFAALPAGVAYGDADLVETRKRGQVRLWWDSTPIDLFFAADAFHREVATRCRSVPFEGRRINVLSAEDLAVFKAMFDRTKDWADIEAMVDSHAIDLDLAADRLHDVLGDDARVGRLRSLDARP